jgi:intracellular multiplication protein IcmK
MTSFLKTSTSLLAAAIVLALPASAQDAIPLLKGPQTAQSGQGFSGYVPSRVSGGMVSGGSGSQSSEGRGPSAVSATDGLATGTEATPDRIEGFNAAVQDVFPMTPDMLRRYRDIFEASERAMLEREEPSAKIDAGFISLEPGETPAQLTVAPGIASVIGIYDATGQAWPISQYVLGSGENFQVIQLGDSSNNLAITPLVRIGWTNLVIVLKDEPKPIVMRIEISEGTAHYRHDIQVMRNGPNAVDNLAVATDTVREAGSTTLLAALTGVDLPAGTVRVPIRGVDARGWMVGDRLFIRSRHALLSPSWEGSMSGPDGIRVYELNPASVALFSVDGAIVRADVEIP